MTPQRARAPSAGTTGTSPSPAAGDDQGTGFAHLGAHRLGPCLEQARVGVGTEQGHRLVTHRGGDHPRKSGETALKIGRLHG